MKNGKAAGTSEIVGEMLKAGGSVMERWLVAFLRKVWKEEKIPEDWKEGVVIPLYMKGD
jgi:hypothetical protein